MSQENRSIFQINQTSLNPVGPLVPTPPGSDISKRKCSCPPHSPPNSARKKHYSVSGEGVSAPSPYDKPKKKKNKKKKKRRPRKEDEEEEKEDVNKLDNISTRQVTKVEPLDKKTPKTLEVDLSERFNNTLPSHIERRVLSPLATTNDSTPSESHPRSIQPPLSPEKIRHVLIPPIALEQASRRVSHAAQDVPLRRRREGRHRRRHSFESDCSSDGGDQDLREDPLDLREDPLDLREDPLDLREDPFAIVPYNDEDDEKHSDGENTDDDGGASEKDVSLRQPNLSDSLHLTMATSPPHLTMPLIDDAVRHSGSSNADAESDAAYYRRALQARRAVEGTTAERDTYLQEQETAQTNYFDECSSPLPKIIVGSFGFAEEGNSHFLKMEVWDTLPVRCNSR
jgi:hypothetical protein